MGSNDLFSVILMAVILMGIGFFVSQPLLRARPENIFEDDFEESPLQRLMAKKDTIYTAMKDLEFDFTTGKLSDEDYEILKDKFSIQAADVLKELDGLKSGKAVRATAKTQAGTKSATKTAVKTAVKTKNACSACGFKFEEGDRFCQSCGEQLT